MHDGGTNQCLRVSRGLLLGRAEDGEGVAIILSAGARLLALERARDILQPVSQVELATARVRL